MAPMTVSSFGAWLGLELGTEAAAWVRGVIWGVWLVLFVQFVFVTATYVLLFDPTRRRVQPPLPAFPASLASASPTNTKVSRGSPDPGAAVWPPRVVTYLEQMLKTNNTNNASTSSNTNTTSAPFEWDAIDPHMTPPDEAAWLNVIVARVFLSLRDSVLFNDRTCAKLSDRINSKLTGNSFVSHVTLHDISLGENVPKIHSVRMLKGITDDLAVCLEIELSYEGGASVGIEPTLTSGYQIPVRATINALKGKVRVRVPAIGYQDMFSVSFLENPGVSFRIDAPTITVRNNNTLRSVISTVLSEIVRRVFLDMWVLPAWRTLFLPLMLPSLDEEMARMDEVNEISRDAKIASTISGNSSGGGGGIIGLKRSQKTAEYFQRALSKRDPNLAKSQQQPYTSLSGFFGLKVYDTVDSSVFPVSLIVDSSINSASLALLEDAIVSPFLEIAREGFASSAALQTAASVDSEWRTIKNSSGILVRRCRKKYQAISLSEISCAAISIACDTEWVYSVSEYDVQLIRETIFKLKNAEKSLKLFEIHKKIATSYSASSSSELAPQDDEGMKKTANSYIVVFRSISNVINDSPVPSFGSNEDSPPSPTHEEYVDAPTGPSPSQLHFEQFLDASLPQQQPSRSETPDSLIPQPATSSRTPSPSRQSSYVPDHMITEAVTKKPPPAFPIRESSITPSLTSTATPATAKTAITAQPTVFLQGYLIEPNPSDIWNSSTVTVISHLSPDLAKLETNYAICKKLKTFIEEVKHHFEQFEDGGGDFQQPQRRNRVADASAAVGAGIAGLITSAKGQELKNYLVSSSAAAAGYLMKGKSRNGGSLLVVKNNSSSGGGVDSENEDSDNNAATTEIIDGNSNSIRPGSSVSAGSNSKKIFDSESLFFARTATGNNETAIVVSNSSYQKQRSELVSSAVAFAKNVGLKRPASIGFLTRAALAAAGGGSIQQVDSPIQSAGFSQLSSSFSIGDNPETEFIQKCIAPKETGQIEIPFRRQDFHAAVELSWEFIIKDLHQITFGLSFRPDCSSTAYNNSISAQFPESISESLENSTDTRQIIPVSVIANTAAIPSHRGNLSLSLFCSGTFVFFWDNSTGSSKKLEKEVWFRAVFRPFEIPVALTKLDAIVSSIDDDTVGEFGFERKEQQHCTGMTGEVTVAKKSLYRAFVTYDSSMERFNDAGEPETLTFLTWDYSTNGFDVLFGVSYNPFSPNDSTSVVDNVSPVFEEGVSQSEVGTIDTKTTFEIQNSAMKDFYID
ncbi:hypothetical protein HK100_006717, partial [Physocladia obscura]